MLIKFYKTSSEPKSYPKVLQNELLVNGTIRDENGFDIMNPTLRIVDINPLSYNYLYIEEFLRYYFIVKPIYYRNNVYDLVLHEDVLQSHYAKFELLNAFINRNENDFNPMIKDDRIPLYPAQTDILVPLLETKSFVKPTNIYDADFIIGVASTNAVPYNDVITYLYKSSTSNNYDSYIVTQEYSSEHLGIDVQPFTEYEGSTIDREAIICYPIIDTGVVTQMHNTWTPEEGYSGMAGFGNYVIVYVNSPTPYYIIFAHMTSVADGISIGTPIGFRDELGVVGNTGRTSGATGIHTHIQTFTSFNPSISANTFPYYNVLPIPNILNTWIRGAEA